MAVNDTLELPSWLVVLLVQIVLHATKRVASGATIQILWPGKPFTKII
jgi:hypothetical protein